MLKGRQFVYKELVATEADYVRDLECVVNVSGLAPGFRVLPTLVSGGRAQPPLRKFYHHSALKTAFFYYHLVFKIVCLPPFGLRKVQTDRI